MTSVILQINKKLAFFTFKVFSNVNKNCHLGINKYVYGTIVSALSAVSSAVQTDGFSVCLAFITLHAEIFVHGEGGWIWQARECYLLQLITLVPAVEIPVKFSKDTCGKIITSRTIKELNHRTNPSKHGLQGIILRGEEVQWRPHSIPSQFFFSPYTIFKEKIIAIFPLQCWQQSSLVLFWEQCESPWVMPQCTPTHIYTHTCTHTEFALSIKKGSAG